jgi:glycosyltransferase involved in cell wall biosynthesis
MSKNRKRQRTPERRPTLAVCVIARNEEEFIGACLESVRGVADEMIVVDTGSTDRTSDIARALGARVEFFAWCDDFAAARNAAIDAAAADWILMLDADEELDPECMPGLQSLIAKALPGDSIGYSVLVDNRRRDESEASVRHCVTRLFPRRSDFRYVGAIHEDLFRASDLSRSSVVFAPEVRIFHYGYDPDLYIARDKDARNLRLLQLALSQEPNNPRLLFHLGQQHRVGTRYAEAVDAFARFEPHADRLPRHYRVDAYRIWIEALIALGDDSALDEVVRRADDAEALSAQSRHILGQYELNQGRLGIALRHLLFALSPNAPLGVAAEPGVGGWRTRLLLVETYEKLEEPQSALAELERALPDMPTGQRFSAALLCAKLALDADDCDGTLQRLEVASEVAPDEVESQSELLRLRLEALRGVTALPEAGLYDSLDGALAFGEWQAAYDAALCLNSAGAASLVRMLHLASELRDRRAPEAALDVLTRAVDAHPASAPLYWLLVQVLTDLERFDDALVATEVLKKVSAAA